MQFALIYFWLSDFISFYTDFIHCDILIVAGTKTALLMRGLDHLMLVRIKRLRKQLLGFMKQ
jgi:hypothetical protein